MSDATENPRRPVCRLVDEDGNALNVIGRVRRALRNDGQPERATEFVRRAWAAGSYEALLCLVMEYVEVR